MARKLSPLVAAVTLDINDWSAGIKQMQRDQVALTRSLAPVTRAMADVGRGFTVAGAAVSAIGVPFALLAKNAINNAESLFNMAQRTGNTVEALSALKLKAELADISLGDLETILKKANVSLENAASGSKVAEASLAKLGVTSAQLMKMSPDERFFAMAQGLAAIEDPATQAGVAVEVFGRSGTDVLNMVESMKGGLQGAIEEARVFGVLISGEGAKAAERFNDSLTLLGKTFGGLMNAVVSSGLLDMLSALIEFIAKAVGQFAKAHPWIATVGVALGALAAVLGPLLIVIGLSVSAIAALIPMLASAAAAIGAIGAPALLAVGAIAAIVAVVAGAVTALVAFIASNEETRMAVTEAWNQIYAAGLELFQTIVPVFKQLAAELKAVWAIIGPDTQNAFAFIVNTAVHMIKNFASVITTGLKVITGTIQAFHGLATGDFTKFSAGVQKIWSALWNALKAVMMIPINAIKAAIADLTASITGRFKAMYDAVVGKSYVPDMIDGIRDAFGRLDEYMVDPTRRAANGVMSSFKNMFDTVLGFARDWKGTLKNMLGDILGGIDLKALLKGDFGSILQSVKDTLGLGGGKSSGNGGILGGIFGGSSGGSVASTGMSAAMGWASVGASLVEPIANQLNKIGGGRDSANEVIKSQNAFEATLDAILKDTALSPTNKFKQVGNAWEGFQANLGRFSAAGGEGGVTANQAFATVSPLVSQILTDQIKAGASDGSTGNGGDVTVNLYLTDVHSPEEFIEWLKFNRNGIREEIARGVQLTNPAVVSR